AERRGEVEEARLGGAALPADVGQDEPHQLGAKLERQPEQVRGERAAPAERRDVLAGGLEERGHPTRPGAEEGLPARRVAGRVGQRDLVVATLGREGAAGAVRRIAPEEPEALVADGVEPALDVPAWHVLQF